MERSLLDSRLLFWFSLCLLVISTGNYRSLLGQPSGMAASRDLDQRALRQISGGTKAVDGQFRETSQPEPRAPSVLPPKQEP